MTTTLRLWSDCALDPFYVDEGDGRFLLTAGDDVAEQFGIPSRVMEAISTWDQLYQEVLDGLDPANSGFPTDEAHQQYLERGREAARLLRRHLPPDIEIEYLADGSVREYF